VDSALGTCHSDKQPENLCKFSSYLDERLDGFSDRIVHSSHIAETFARVQNTFSGSIPLSCSQEVEEEFSQNLN